MSFSDNFFCFSASFLLRLSSSRRFLFSSSRCRFFSNSLLLLSSRFSSLILCGNEGVIHLPDASCFTELCRSFHFQYHFDSYLFLDLLIFDVFQQRRCPSGCKYTSSEIKLMVLNLNLKSHHNYWQFVAVYLWAPWSWPRSLQALSPGWPLTSPHHRRYFPGTVCILGLKEFQNWNHNQALVRNNVYFSTAFTVNMTTFFNASSFGIFLFNLFFGNFLEGGKLYHSRILLAWVNIKKDISYNIQATW